MAELLQRADGLVETLGSYFPPSVWAAKAMAYASSPLGWLNFLLFSTVTVTGGALLLALGGGYSRCNFWNGTKKEG